MNDEGLQRQGATLEAVLLSGSSKELLSAISSLLTNKNFRAAQTVLAPLLFGPGALLAPQEALQLLLRCLNTLAAGEIPSRFWAHGDPLPLSHLLVELIPNGRGPTPQCSAPDVRACAAAAAQLVETRYLSAASARLAVKVVQAFGLTIEDFTNKQAVIEFVAQLVAERATFGPAVTLLMLLEGLDEHFDKGSILGDLVAEGLEGAAEKWVASLGKEYQIVYVEQCIAQERLKAASRAVRQFGLREEFPDVEFLYRQKTVSRLLAKRLWAVATTFVGNDAELQAMVVRQMVECGESAMAEEYRSLFNLPVSALTVDPVEVEAEERRREAHYLQLQVPPENRLMVDSRETLEVASRLLAPARLLGLDVEWKPTHLAGAAASNPASLLQVSTESHVLVFDLLALGMQPELDACLKIAFHNKDALKVGFELAGDLGKLASSYPSLSCFSRVESVLELRHMWAAHLMSRPNISPTSVKVQRGAGLSTLCSALLGKPLDKSMQVSDWESRPLSARQFRYACLDAAALVQLYRHFEATLPNFAGLRDSKTYTYVASPQKRARSSSGGGPPDGPGEGPPPSGGGAGAGWRRDGEGRAGEQQRGASGEASESSGGGNDDNGGGAGTSCWLANGSWGSLSGRGGLGSSGGSPTAGELLRPVAMTGNDWASSSSAAAADMRRPCPEANEQLCCSGSPPPPHVRSLATGRPRSDGATSSSSAGPHDRLTVPDGLPNTGRDSPPSRSSYLSTPGSGDQRLSRALEEPGCPVVIPPLIAARLRELGLLAAFTWLPPSASPFPAAAAAAVEVGLRDLGVGSTLGTAISAARTLQVPVGRVAKSLALLAGTQPWLVVARGDVRVDLHKVAAAIGVTRKQVRFASAADCVTTFGYAPGQVTVAPQVALAGTLPPFGHPLDLPRVLIDGGLQPQRSGDSMAGRPAQGSSGPDLGGADALLFCGAGRLDASVCVTFAQLLALSRGRVADVVADRAWEDGAVAPAASEQSQEETGSEEGQQAAVPAVVATVASGPGPAFLLDSMLGRLMRWLRCMGVDAEHVDHAVPRERMVELVRQATAAGRVVLTRDVRLVSRRECGAAFLLHSTDPEAQLAEVAEHFGLRLGEGQMMSRCPRCNAAAFRAVAREDVAGRVSDRVVGLVHEFYACGNCLKVFWMGPKSYSALSKVEGIARAAGVGLPESAAGRRGAIR